MPRGRHRHSQPLHRLLPPVAVTVAGLACAGGSWFVGGVGTSDTEILVLRGLTAAAAVAGAAGAVLARRWDRAAGRQVAELKARQTRTEWRAEEQQADLESDLEESRRLRQGLEKKLRDKRIELARLRTEHAALLRRYANAETGRASALEGRRQLEIEAGEPAPRQLTSGVTDHRLTSGAPSPLTYRQAYEALGQLKRNAERQRERDPAVPAPDALASAVPDGSAPVPPDSGTSSGSGGGGGFDFFGTRHAGGGTGEGGTGDAAPGGASAESAQSAASAEPAAGAEGARTMVGERPAGVTGPVRRVPAGAAGKVIDLSEQESEPEPAAGPEPAAASGTASASVPAGHADTRDTRDTRAPSDAGDTTGHGALRSA